jgi:TetR/AcrR family transcriptional regulator, regulator of biofilm formation and stress response
MSAAPPRTASDERRPPAPEPERVARTRRRDPDRRQRIAAAAVTVIERDGLLALSHRAVAAEAGVPLGSTTYYFEDLDALLVAALERLSEHELRVLDEWATTWDLRTQLEDALVSLVLGYTNDQRDRSTLEYEVHMLAYRRNSLKPPSHRWEIAFAELLSTVLEPAEVPIVIASFDAIMLHGLDLDEALTDDWAREYLRRVLRPSQA